VVHILILKIIFYSLFLVHEKERKTSRKIFFETENFDPRTTLKSVCYMVFVIMDQLSFQTFFKWGGGKESLPSAFSTFVFNLIGCSFFISIVKLRKPAHGDSRAFKNDYEPVLVAHTCNPSYSGGRDQEDHNSKPALAK
jgi:hypothetical protein